MPMCAALRALHGYGGVWEILHLPLLPAPTDSAALLGQGATGFFCILK